MHSSIPEKRGKPRSRLRFPVVIYRGEADEGRGITRDVSEYGVYFYTSSCLEIGQAVEFKTLVPTPGETTARAFCNGTVLRVDPPDHAKSQSHGVAVRLNIVRLVH